MRLVVGAVALCMASWAASLSSQPPPVTGEARQDQKGGADDKTDHGGRVTGPQKPLPAAGSESQPPQPADLKAQRGLKNGDRDHQGEQGKGWNWERLATITNAAAALAIAGFTFYLMRYARRQADATQASAAATAQSAAAAEQSVTAMRASTAIATDALAHAKATADKTHELDRKARRAWILPEPWLFPGKNPKWGSMAPWVYNLSFVNIGQLPAFDAKVTAQVERDGPSLDVKTATGRAYFIRDQSHNYMFTVPEASLGDGQLTIRVEITYTDPIDSKGRTAFSMRLEPVDSGTFYLSRENSIVE